MPVLGSGVMFDEYIVPKGVAIARPPANRAPPGFVWQATQSPARARYSPLVTRAWSSACAAVADRRAEPDNSTNAARASSHGSRSIRTAPLSVCFAAAAERHLQCALWHG